ncbi:MAG: hypothetical protein AMXMBFR82_49090 [Candidatus Hydrogenedentota bacterium]
MKLRGRKWLQSRQKARCLVHGPRGAFQVRVVIWLQEVEQLSAYYAAKFTSGGAYDLNHGPVIHTRMKKAGQPYGSVFGPSP